MYAQSPANASVRAGIDQELPERVQSSISLVFGSVTRVFVAKHAVGRRVPLPAAGRQLRFYIDPERPQNMSDAKKILTSSQNAIDMYAAQFLA